MCRWIFKDRRVGSSGRFDLEAGDNWPYRLYLLYEEETRDKNRKGNHLMQYYRVDFAEKHYTSILGIHERMLPHSIESCRK